MDTFGNFFNKVIDIFDLLDSVIKQEVDICIDPKNNSVLKFFNQWSSIDSQPSDINRVLHIVDFMLDACQHGDLLVERIKSGLLGLDSIEDL